MQMAVLRTLHPKLTKCPKHYRSTIGQLSKLLELNHRVLKDTFLLIHKAILFSGINS